MLKNSSTAPEMSLLGFRVSQRDTDFLYKHTGHLLTYSVLDLHIREPELAKSSVARDFGLLGRGWIQELSVGCISTVYHFLTVYTVHFQPAICMQARRRHELGLPNLGCMQQYIWRFSQPEQPHGTNSSYDKANLSANSCRARTFSAHGDDVQTDREAAFPCTKDRGQGSPRSEAVATRLVIPLIHVLMLPGTVLSLRARKRSSRDCIPGTYLDIRVGYNLKPILPLRRGKQDI